MSQKIERLHKILPELSRSQLEQVRDRVDFLLQASGEEEEVIDDHRLFYEALVKGVSIAARIDCPPFKVFCQSRYFSYFVEKLPPILMFINTNLPNLKKVERIKLYGICANVLVRQLQDQNVPISIGSVCTNLHRLPELVEKAFPGYIAAGLFSVLVRAGLEPRVEG